MSLQDQINSLEDQISSFKIRLPPLENNHLREQNLHLELAAKHRIEIEEWQLQCTKVNQFEAVLLIEKDKRNRMHQAMKLTESKALVQDKIWRIQYELYLNVVEKIENLKVKIEKLENERR